MNENTDFNSKALHLSILGMTGIALLTIFHVLQKVKKQKNKENNDDKCTRT